MNKLLAKLLESRTSAILENIKFQGMYDDNAEEHYADEADLTFQGEDFYSMLVHALNDRDEDDEYLEIIFPDGSSSTIDYETIGQIVAKAKPDNINDAYESDDRFDQFMHVVFAMDGGQ